MTKIRILIADDHAILRSGLKMLIAAQPDMEVVAEAADGAEALRLAIESRPDVALVDLTMPGPPSSLVIQEIVRRAQPARVLVLTMHDDPAYMQSSMMAGATGYVVKRAADAELLTALRAVHRGRTFVDLTRKAGMENSPAASHPGRTTPLSPRETQVLQLLAQGHTNQEAADMLGVSVKTVETYRSRLGEKLGLRSRASLFRFAVEAGLLASSSGSDSAETVLSTTTPSRISR
jgi:two-component system, NarL family, response regulator NreC